MLSGFMEAANILMIDGLSDKDKVEKRDKDKVERNDKNMVEMNHSPNPLPSTQDNINEACRGLNDDENEMKNVKSEYLDNVESASCDLCDFKTTAKSKNNQTSVLKRHKRKVHEGNGENPTETAENSLEEISESAVETEDNSADERDGSYLHNGGGGLFCTICGFVTTAK